jgi:SAM-dependent methyltransferase
MLYNLLDRPAIYRLSQLLVAPGAEKSITRKIDQLLSQLPSAQHVLDVGCGPSSWLWRARLHPVGLDISADYTAAFGQLGELVVNGSATALPFADECFEGIWSIGLLHHLPDVAVRETLSEMLRVCRTHGYVVVLDAVLPEPVWSRPIAYTLRRLDRGGFVRHQGDLLSLLPSRQSWRTERFSYTYTGLELVGCYFIRSSNIERGH